MKPVRASVTIERPREEVFAYLADLANHAEFTDHYLKDWRLTRLESVGRGAGARFKIAAPGARFNWGDVTFTEVVAPERIVELGAGGKFNRVRTRGTWELEDDGYGGTKVSFTLESRPGAPWDRIQWLLGGRLWFARATRKAVRRLRRILERGEGRGARPTVAGG